MEFRVLGPLEVSAAGRPLGLGGRKQRTVLAMLLLHANELVPRDRLIDALWGEEPPAEAEANLRVYIARLRKLFAAEPNGRPSVETTANGYLLRIEPEKVDLERFRRLVADGDFAEALELWRGPALADLAEEEWARREAGVLDELRLNTLEERIDLDLAAGRHAELVPELEKLVAEHPYRERVVAQLMLALYRSGRQPDALEAYKRLGNALRDTFGLEATRALRDLERRILVQDPALEVRDTPKRRVAAHVRRRRRTAIALAVATVGALAAGAALLLPGSQQRAASQGERLVGNSVVAIDADSTDVIGEVPVGGRPQGVTLGEGSLWVANADDRTLLRIDPRTRAVVDTIGLGVPPSAMTVGGGSVWAVSQAANVVLQVDPTLDEVVATIDLPEIAVDLCCPHQVAFARGALWVSFWSSLVRIDPAERKAVQTPFRYVRSIAGTGDALWAVTGIEANQVQRLEPLGDPIRLGPDRASGGVHGIAATERDVWTYSFRGTFSRIEAETSRLDVSAAVGRMVYGFAATRDSLWVVTLGRDVVRIDPVTGRRLKRLRLGLFPPYAPNVIAAGPDEVWIAVLAR